MPSFLPNESIKTKPMPAQRKKVHSYIYPSMFDLQRWDMKNRLKEKLTYANLNKTGPISSDMLEASAIQGDFDRTAISDTFPFQGHKPRNKTQEPSVMYRQVGVVQGEQVELAHTDKIPMRALRQTLDKTHEMLLAWKQDQVAR